MKKIIFLMFSILIIPISYGNDLSGILIQTCDKTPTVIPRNGVGISFLNLAITAKEKDIYIKALILQKTGLSDRSDVEGVRATTQFNRSFLGKVNHNDQVRLRFLKPVFIRKGDTQNFEITANLDAKVGRTIGFELIEIETPDRQTTRHTNLPNIPNTTASNTKNISGFDIQQLSFKLLGSNKARLRFGRAARIGRFRIQNEGTKSSTLQQLTLKNKGTARLDKTFEQLELRNNLGEIVARSSYLSSKQVSFVFNDIFFYGGEGLTLDVWGTVVGGRTGRTIELVLDEPSDLTASSTGFGAATRNPSNPTSVPQHTLDQRDRATYRTPNAINSLWNQNYVPGSRDVVFLSENIRHDAPIFIEDVLMFVANGSMASDKNGNGIPNEISDFQDTFEDMSLYIDGRLHDQNDDFEINNGQLVLRFHGDLELYNTANIMVTGKISHQAINGDRLRLTIDPQKTFPDWELLR